SRDWSSDVCSSDLPSQRGAVAPRVRVDANDSDESGRMEDAELNASGDQPVGVGEVRSLALYGRLKLRDAHDLRRSDKRWAAWTETPVIAGLAGSFLIGAVRRAGEAHGLSASVVARQGWHQLPWDRRSEDRHDRDPADEESDHPYVPPPPLY